jgi:hypothetical protein
MSPANTLTLDFQPPALTVGNTFLIFQPPSLWYFMTAALQVNTTITYHLNLDATEAPTEAE